LDFASKTVDEIKEILINEGLDGGEVFSLRSKSDLADLYYEHMAKKSMSQAVLDKKQPKNEDEDVDSDEAEPVSRPPIGSPGWEDFVLNHLQEKEYEEKNGKKFPKASGLRRVTQLLLGPIIKSGPVSVITNGDITTVMYEVQVAWTEHLKGWVRETELTSDIRVFTEVADCSILNTPSPYNLHPSATASSRAAGRAYRNALQLSVVTAEELSLNSQMESVPKSYDEEPITATQCVMIQNTAEVVGVSVEKLLEYEKLPKNLTTLTRAQGGQLSAILNRYQAGEDVPESVRN
jgi:hypothetical protein